MSYEPLYRSRPSHRWTNGDLAAKVGADLGLPPDDEQKWILDAIYAEDAPDRPSAFEVAVVGPRQNIKTSTLGTAALADLFVFEIERHLWSAHLQDTAAKTFADFKAWIQRNPDYDEQVQFYEGHQDMSIVHRETGNVIDFASRTGKAGRGITGVKRITLDEALYLEPKHIGAVYPTMLTKPGAQVRIASSAGLVGSAELRRIRDRGRSGKDRRLAYVEYGAKPQPCLDRECLHAVGTEGCALDDRALWWQANCALWAGRVTEESLVDLRGSMPPEEFAREFLSWWDDPVSVGGAIHGPTWRSLADPAAPRGEHVVFGLDVTSERTGWISVAWQRPDGALHVVLESERGTRPEAAVDRCAELVERWGGTVVAPAAFEDDLVAAGVNARVMRAGEFPAACGKFLDHVTAGTIRHGNQKPLNDAVEAVAWRIAGTDGSRAWQMKDAPEIGPLVAATRAMHGVSIDYDVLESVW